MYASHQGQRLGLKGKATKLGLSSLQHSGMRNAELIQHVLDW